MPPFDFSIHVGAERAHCHPSYGYRGNNPVYVVPYQPNNPIYRGERLGYQMDGEQFGYRMAGDSGIGLVADIRGHHSNIALAVSNFGGRHFVYQEPRYVPGISLNAVGGTHPYPEDQAVSQNQQASQVSGPALAIKKEEALRNNDRTSKPSDQPSQETSSKQSGTESQEPANTDAAKKPAAETKAAPEAEAKTPPAAAHTQETHAAPQVSAAQKKLNQEAQVYLEMLHHDTGQFDKDGKRTPGAGQEKLSHAAEGTTIDMLAKEFDGEVGSRTKDALQKEGIDPSKPITQDTITLLQKKLAAEQAKGAEKPQEQTEPEKQSEVASTKPATTASTVAIALSAAPVIGPLVDATVASGAILVDNMNNFATTALTTAQEKVADVRHQSEAEKPAASTTAKVAVETVTGTAALAALPAVGAIEAPVVAATGVVQGMPAFKLAADAVSSTVAAVTGGTKHLVSEMFSALPMGATETPSAPAQATSQEAGLPIISIPSLGIVGVTNVQDVSMHGAAPTYGQSQNQNKDLLANR